MMIRVLKVALCERLLQSFVLLAGIISLSPGRTGQAAVVVEKGLAYSCGEVSDYFTVHYKDTEWNSAGDPLLAEYVQLTPPTNLTYFSCMRIGTLPLRGNESVVRIHSWRQWKKIFDDSGKLGYKKVGLSITTTILMNSSSDIDNDTHTFSYSGQNASFRFQDGFQQSPACILGYEYLPRMSYADVLEKNISDTCTLNRGGRNESACPKWKAVDCASMGSRRLIETSHVVITPALPDLPGNRSDNVSFLTWPSTTNATVSTPPTPSSATDTELTTPVSLPQPPGADSPTTPTAQPEPPKPVDSSIANLSTPIWPSTTNATVSTPPTPSSATDTEHPTPVSPPQPPGTDSPTTPTAQLEPPKPVDSSIANFSTATGESASPTSPRDTGSTESSSPEKYALYIGLGAGLGFLLIVVVLIFVINAACNSKSKDKKCNSKEQQVQVTAKIKFQKGNLWIDVPNNTKVQEAMDGQYNNSTF